MKLRNDGRILAAFTACVVSCLPACERVLDVVDQLEPPGSGPGGPIPNPSDGTPTNAPCECASSASLQPLSCGLPAVPLLDNDVVQLTADGGVVAFNVCEESFGACQVVRWDASTASLEQPAWANASIISSGLMLGLSASGQHVLSTGDGTPPGVELTDVNGPTTHLPLDMLIGQGSLSAAGDTVVGGQWLDDVGYLSRADVATGEVEQLGVIGGSAARTYVTPDASQIIGWGFDDLDAPDLGEVLTYVFRWTEQDGFEVGLPGVAVETELWPSAISVDGSVIAGRLPGNGTNFRYTEAGGLVELNQASGRSDTFLSGDGSVVVGSMNLDDGSGEATFRWTAAGGVQNLTPGVPTLAIDASDDGGVVVASSWENAQIEGAKPLATFVWDGANGTRTLEEVLQDRDVDVSGWNFGHARAISGDGKVLVGRATCGGSPTLYRIVLSD